LLIGFLPVANFQTTISNWVNFDYRIFKIQIGYNWRWMPLTPASAHRTPRPAEGGPQRDWLITLRP